MPAFAPAPRFHGKPVYITFDRRVSRPYVIFTAVHDLVRQMQDTGTEDELLIRIHELVGEYSLVAHLIALTPESIEFQVGKT